MGNINLKQSLINKSKDIIYIYDENNNKKFINCSDINSIIELFGTDKENIKKYKLWKKNKLDIKIINNIREINKLCEIDNKPIHYITEL